MKHLVPVAFAAIVAALGGTYLWARLGAEARSAAGAARVEEVAKPVHAVTAPMLEESARMVGQPAPAIEGRAHDGREVRSTALAADRPLVVVFIKDGCPCSAAAEPFFRELHEAYGAHASFLGVIDGTPEAARAWAEKYRTPYPVVADGANAAMHAYRAENSTYTALVAPGGVIEAYWPGNSAEMFGELGARLAGHAGVPAAALDLAEAPATLESGCPFE